MKRYKINFMCNGENSFQCYDAEDKEHAEEQWRDFWGSTEDQVSWISTTETDEPLASTRAKEMIDDFLDGKRGA